MEFLDPTTVMKLMSVLAHPSFNLNVRLGDKLLGAVEDKIEADMPEYMNLDVSQPIICLLRLDYRPMKLIRELNQMNRLSILKIE